MRLIEASVDDRHRWVVLVDVYLLRETQSQKQRSLDSDHLRMIGKVVFPSISGYHRVVRHTGCPIVQTATGKRSDLNHLGSLWILKRFEDRLDVVVHPGQR